MGQSCQPKKGNQTYNLAIGKAWLTQDDWLKLGKKPNEYPSIEARKGVGSIIIENGKLLALFKISELAIDGVSEMLASLTQKRIKIELLSGDHSEKVKSFVKGLNGIEFNFD